MFMSGDWAGQSWSTLIFFALRNFDVEMEVMSILSNPSGVSSQPQHDFSISPLHSATLDCSPSNVISGSCSQRSAEASIKTVDSPPSSQSYCPPTYGTTSYSMDSAVAAAGYQYSQYGQNPLPYSLRIQGLGYGHIVDYDGGSSIRDPDRNGGSCIVLADRDNKGRSCIMLASDNGGGPRLRWQLMVDPDGGSGQ
ncbi:unnamed protein product [Pleuronectes platessa]|uniref:Uncharacterized protein n=1 Tax=Pleuronectes platessa TaxID=8262 RepID=A0A9N7UXM5_PLEPL|nr:unnamed protein product [Pleuronectes platessa]